MVLDQSNTAVWDGGWTVTSNDLRQTFTPTLPRLIAVEVDLVLGHPGPAPDRITVTIDAGGGEASPPESQPFGWRLTPSQMRTHLTKCKKMPCV